MVEAPCPQEMIRRRPCVLVEVNDHFKSFHILAGQGGEGRMVWGGWDWGGGKNYDGLCCLVWIVYSAMLSWLVLFGADCVFSNVLMVSTYAGGGFGIYGLEGRVRYVGVP